MILFTALFFFFGGLSLGAVFSAVDANNSNMAFLWYVLLIVCLLAGILTIIFK
jgi:hypothetical protein